MSPGLLTIGEFSKRCRLTIVALRHYDREGLLRPAEIDPRTGYRYYRADQVAVALQLALLRRVGVPIAELRSFVHGAIDLRELLARQRSRLAQELRDRQETIAVIDALAIGEPAAYDMVRGVEPPRRAAALVVDMTWARVEQATRHALARMAVALRRRGDRAPSSTLSTGALFPIVPAERVTVTVFALDHNEVCPPLTTITLASVDALSTLHRGDHRLLGYAYRAVLAQVAARGLEAAGPAREHYAVDAYGRAGTRLVVPVVEPVHRANARRQ